VGENEMWMEKVWTEQAWFKLQLDTRDYNPSSCTMHHGTDQNSSGITVRACALWFNPEGYASTCFGASRSWSDTGGRDLLEFGFIQAVFKVDHVLRHFRNFDFSCDTPVGSLAMTCNPSCVALSFS